jgi:hypothetical protein
MTTVRSQRPHARATGAPSSPGSRLSGVLGTNTTTRHRCNQHLACWATAREPLAVAPAAAAARACGAGAGLHLIILVVDFDNWQRLAPTRRKQRHIVIVNNRLSWAPASQMQLEPNYNHALAVGLVWRKEF